MARRPGFLIRSYRRARLSGTTIGGLAALLLGTGAGRGIAASAARLAIDPDDDAEQAFLAQLAAAPGWRRAG